MNKQIATSIESMQRVSTGKVPGLGLYIDKAEGCIKTTMDKNRLSQMYEIADWVQYLTNHAASRQSSQDLKRLHDTFLVLWNNYISQLTISRVG